MFVFVFAWLAQHHKPRVVLTAGTALLVAGIGIFAAGFSTHQPLISRFGALITIAAIIFAVFAIRTRHSRARKNEGQKEARHRCPESQHAPGLSGLKAGTAGQKRPRTEGSGRAFWLFRWGGQGQDRTVDLRFSEA